MWQPIETAPKDRREILVIDKSKTHSIVYWEDVFDMNYWECCASGMEIRPTHWMPLPEPPE